jgi:hypothetical protein
VRQCDPEAQEENAVWVRGAVFCSIVDNAQVDGQQADRPVRGGHRLVATVEAGRISITSDGVARGAVRLPCGAIPRWPRLEFVAAARQKRLAELGDDCGRAEIECSRECDLQFVQDVKREEPSAESAFRQCNAACRLRSSECSARPAPVDRASGRAESSEQSAHGARWHVTSPATKAHLRSSHEGQVRALARRCPPTTARDERPAEDEQDQADPSAFGRARRDGAAAAAVVARGK